MYMEVGEDVFLSSVYDYQKPVRPIILSSKLDFLTSSLIKGLNTTSPNR